MSPRFDLRRLVRLGRVGSLAAVLPAGCSLLLACTLTGQASAEGCTRYAAPGGQDTSRGTKGHPFRSAQRLADSLRAGETGCLRGGTYDEHHDGYVLRFGHGGVRGKPITIRSFPGERARLVGIVSVPHGSDHVRLARLVLIGTGAQNSVKVYASRTSIVGNAITNKGKGESCMILGNTSGDGRARSSVIARNRFHECGSLANGNKDHGIYVSNSVGVRIVGNVFSDTAAYSVHLYPHAEQTVVAHNIIDGGGRSIRGGILFGGDSDYASNGNVVKENVIAYSASYNVTSSWTKRVGGHNLVRDNCLWAGAEGNIDRSDGGFAVRGNLVAPPLFVDRSGGDYRLRKTSRCLSVVGYDAAARLR